MGQASLEQLFHVINVLYWFVVPPCGVVDLVRHLKGKPWFPTYFIACAPFYLVSGMLDMALGKSAILDVLISGASIYYIYLWWKQKPPKNGKKSRVLSKIKQMNGRLVLVPVTE